MQPEIILIRGGLSNCYLIREKNIQILVDVGSCREVKNIVARNLISPSFPILVTSTHFHLDHVGGIPYFLKEFPEAEVAFYYQVKAFLSGSQKLELFSFWRWARLGQKSPIFFLEGHRFPSPVELFAWAKAGIPLPFLRSNIRIEYEVSHWLREGPLPYTKDWRVIHCPGHTRDSICLWHPKGKILFSGDTILGLRGRAQLNSLCADWPKIKKSFLNLRRNFPARNIYPGHGRPLLNSNETQTYGVPISSGRT